LSIHLETLSRHCRYLGVVEPRGRNGRRVNMEEGKLIEGRSSTIQEMILPLG